MTMGTISFWGPWAVMIIISYGLTAWGVYELVVWIAA